MIVHALLNAAGEVLLIAGTAFVVAGIPVVSRRVARSRVLDLVDDGAVQ